MMDCRKVQRRLDEFESGRLPTAQRRAMRAHLKDCTDCRVQQQRTIRLQRLLALKTYEQPGERYFDGIAADVHRRLAPGQITESPVDRWLQQLGLDSFLSSRYGWASACAVLLIAGLTWVGLRNTSSLADRHRPMSSEPVVLVETAPLIPPSWPAAPASSAGLGDGAVELVAAGRVPSGSPRYVLDRIGVVPASYEPAHIDF